MSISIIEAGLPHPMWTPQLVPGAVFDDDIGVFVLGVTNPSRRDLEEFHGSGRLGVMPHRRIAVFSIVLGRAVDFSIPYHASLVSHTEPPELFEGQERRLLHFHLVDAITGETLQTRASTVSPHLSKVMQRILRRQATEHLPQAGFLTDVQHWNKTYPTPQSVKRISTWSRLGD